jgi:two-component system, LytTR family, response regulator
VNIMTAIIIDDEANGIITLKKMLEAHCEQVNVLATFSSAVQAMNRLQELKPDVIFLDIQMPGKTGIEMLKELPEKDFEVIFVTAYNEYMLQALQYTAADYLLKPVDEDRLIEAVLRVEKKLTNERGSRIDTLVHNINKAGSPLEMRLGLPTLKGFVVVKLEEIIYCEAERSYSIFHLVHDTKIIVSKSLADYDSLLSAAHFLRIHKSFLVNLQHVKEYQKGEGGIVIMTNGIQLEVSRRRKDLFMCKMKELFRF